MWLFISSCFSKTVSLFLIFLLLLYSPLCTLPLECRHEHSFLRVFPSFCVGCYCSYFPPCLTQLSKRRHKILLAVKRSRLQRWTHYIPDCDCSGPFVLRDCEFFSCMKSLCFFCYAFHNYDDKSSPCCLSSLHCNLCIQKRIDGSDCFFEKSCCFIVIIQAMLQCSYLDFRSLLWIPSSMISTTSSEIQSRFFTDDLVSETFRQFYFISSSRKLNETWKISQCIQSSIKQAVMLSSFVSVLHSVVAQTFLLRMVS